MGGEIKQFEDLLSVLPEGWQDKAKETGALIRGRSIKTAEDLLKLNLLYLTEGKSFGNTAAFLSLTGSYKLNKTAVYKRIAGSGEWLRWMCEKVNRGGRATGIKPEWLGDKGICLVDASEEPVFGNKEKQYRLHYAVNLYTLEMKEMLLTGQERGESLENFKSLGPEDAVMGDRAYGNIKNIEYLKERGSGFILRIKTNAFNIYNGRMRKTSVPSLFKGVKPGESGSATVYYLYKGEYRKLRLCAYRKTKEAERRSLEKLEDSQNWKGRRKGLSEAQKANNRYVVLATSFESPKAEEIAGLYRMRWQIELVFKGLKSLFGYNEVPVKLDKTAKAWFYGKLLLAALTETWVNKARFSPLARRPREHRRQGSGA
jgi:hypothetical protein